MLMPSWFYVSGAVYAQTIDGALIVLRRELTILR